MKHLALFLSMILASLVLAQDSMSHHQMDERGDAVMGFDHDKTTHHFRLSSTGGSIEVTANDPQDTASQQQIRMHLGHIAGMFAAGNFMAPMLVHSTEHPPGTDKMKELKEQIHYEYRDIPNGGAVFISTKDSQALPAIHDFLKFQIEEHKTGDPQTISE